MAMKSLHERGSDLSNALFEFIRTFNDFCLYVEAMRETSNSCVNFDLMTGSLFASTQIINNQILAMLTVFETCSPLNQIVVLPPPSEDLICDECKKNEQN
ncbi:MAG TPA: hypothetical protein V6C65_35620 [Allocoleopsis sp.]